MKNKFRSTGFWLSLTGAVLLVVQQLGLAYGFNVNSDLVNTIVSSVCGLLVMLGVLIPTKNNTVLTNPKIDEESLEENLEEIENEENVVNYKDNKIIEKNLEEKNK